MKRIFFLFIIALTACKNEPSKVDFASYFYPVLKDDKFYIYRDVLHGLDEQIHRIYSLEDSKGKHLIVEVYSADGRITEAYNYSQETLLLDDHMVVDADGKKRQAELLRNDMFPANKEHQTYFATRFPGLADSTVIVYEMQNRPAETKQAKRKVMDEEREVLFLTEDYRFAIVNPFTQLENANEFVLNRYFAKDLGLVEWHDKKMSRHFVLEQVLDAKEGLQLIGRGK
jgi:hypothetical protein